MAPTAEFAVRGADARGLIGRVAAAVPLAERARSRLPSERFVFRGDVTVDRVAPEVAAADRGRGCEAVAGLPKRGLADLAAGDLNGLVEREDGCRFNERNGVLDERGVAALRGLDARLGPREADEERLGERRVAVDRRDDERLGELRLAELRDLDGDRCAERVLRRADERLLPARALDVDLPADDRWAPRRP